MNFRHLALLLSISSTLPALAAGQADNTPAQNPFLAAARYGDKHHNPVAPTLVPYAVPNGTYHVELPKFPRIVGGPGAYLQLESTNPGYLWITSTNGVAYAEALDTRLRQVASLAAPGQTVIPRETLEKLTAQPVASVAHAQTMAKELGVDGARLEINAHAVVDRDNVLYATAGNGVVHAYGLIDPRAPATGIRLLRSLDLRKELERLSRAGPADKAKRSSARVTALAMTYDGHLIVGTTRSVSVTSPKFDGALHTIELARDEVARHAAVVDEKGGVFVASDSALHKLVWTGKVLSKAAADGAWSSPYDVGREVPSAKDGRGTGGAPVLMGYGSDPDKLVVLTDGSDRMKLVAFWRDEIPADFQQRPGTKSRRIAGQLEIGAGLAPKPEFIQTGQPVIVKGYGAFVVNGVHASREKDALLETLLVGPVEVPPLGVERAEWEPSQRAWRSVWTRADVATTGMVPAVSTVSDIVFVHGYTKADGWELTGLAWNSGKTVHRSLFGQDALGNGAHGCIQFLPNGDLLFNSIGGPIRVHFKAVIARPKI
jgi:hypothetical protein